VFAIWSDDRHRPLLPRTLATLRSAPAMPLLTALDIVRTRQEPCSSKVDEDARDAIPEGETSPLRAIKRSGQFPPMVFHMIASWRRSGRSRMLHNVDTRYDCGWTCAAPPYQPASGR